MLEELREKEHEIQEEMRHTSPIIICDFNKNDKTIKLVVHQVRN